MNILGVAGMQCDQIGRFFWTLGNFLKPLATINLPKFPIFFGNFCKGVIIYHFSSDFIFVNFYRHLAIFSGHTAGIAYRCPLPVSCHNPTIFWHRKLVFLVLLPYFPTRFEPTSC